jgi:hypothetical protein
LHRRYRAAHIHANDYAFSHSANLHTCSHRNRDAHSIADADTCAGACDLHVKYND